MQEEEDRELQEAMEATGLSIYPDDYVDPYPYRTRRRLMSLGNVSAPPTLNRTGRFASIGTILLQFFVMSCCEQDIVIYHCIFHIPFPCNHRRRL